MLPLERIVISLKSLNLSLQTCVSTAPGWPDLDLRLVTTLADKEFTPTDLAWSSKTACIRSKNVRCHRIGLASRRTDAGRRIRREKPIYAESRSLLASDLPAQQSLGTTAEAREWYPLDWGKWPLDPTNMR